MKKIYSLTLALLISYSLSATVHTITVSSFQFTPSNNLTVDLGDTIVWAWINGSHTTTSTTIPAGAVAWDSPMNSSSPGFLYVPAVEGVYNYHCTPHAATMQGSFTVVNTSTIKPVTITDGLNISTANNGSSLNISFNINRPASVKISLMDLTGKVAKVLVNSSQLSGKFNEIYSTDELQTGIYIVEMLAGSERYTRRIILQ